MQIKNRLNRLREDLKKNTIDGCFIEDPIDLRYLTGIKLSAGFLCIHLHGCDLFVDGRYFEVAKKEKQFKTHLLSQKTLGQFLDQLQASSKNIWGFDSKKTSYERYRSLKRSIAKVNKEYGTDHKLKPCSGLCEEIRSIKEVDEIKKLQESADLLMKSYQFLKKSIRVGIKEKELARSFEIFALQHGAEGLSFEPIIAFNKNAGMPHHRASDSVLKKNSLILIDIGLMVNGYASDMTRVLFFGKVSSKLERAYEVLRLIQREILDQLKPGVRVSDLDQLAKEKLAEAGYGDLMSHSLGHGVGLEVHEFPKLSVNTSPVVKLKKNMIITIEPGIYFPGIGGLRYEDTVVITESGHKNFFRKLDSDKVNLT